MKNLKEGIAHGLDDLFETMEKRRNRMNERKEKRAGEASDRVYHDVCDEMWHEVMMTVQENTMDDRIKRRKK